MIHHGGGEEGRKKRKKVERERESTPKHFTYITYAENCSPQHANGLKRSSLIIFTDEETRKRKKKKRTKLT